MFLDKIALVVAIIGGLNWGCIGLFNFDLVARIIYTIVGLAALWCVTMLFRTEETHTRHSHA